MIKNFILYVPNKLELLKIMNFNIQNKVKYLKIKFILCLVELWRNKFNLEQICTFDQIKYKLLIPKFHTLFH